MKKIITLIGILTLLAISVSAGVDCLQLAGDTNGPTYCCDDNQKGCIPEHEVPEFGVIGGAAALIGAGAYVLSRRKK